MKQCLAVLVLVSAVAIVVLQTNVDCTDNDIMPHLRADRQAKIECENDSICNHPDFRQRCNESHGVKECGVFCNKDKGICFCKRCD
jgi:hypothetical protein